MSRAGSALVALVAALAVGGCSAGSGPATTGTAAAPRPPASGFTVGMSAGAAPTREAQLGSEL
ncbi:MAG: transporter substrate-binding domain-containing protein, partial [Thermoleophilaceae bacterium]